MDELVKMVTQKTGISEDQAKQAVNVVLDYLKKNLPAPVAGQIDGLLSNEAGVKQAGDLLGGMFGKK